MTSEVTVARWLPTGFIFEPTQSSTYWMDFGARLLVEPFFNQTVQRLKATQPMPAQRVTDLDALLVEARGLRRLAPKGLIFHVSRCGSTFLGNMFKTAGNIAVLSEARPVETFFQRNVFARSNMPEVEAERMRRAALDAVLSLYARDALAAPADIVIKCCAADMLRVRLIRAIWPQVPFVVIIRDPIEVMVSNLAKPAAWLRAYTRPAFSAKLFGWTQDEVEAMPREEYCARGIGRFCEMTREALDEGCLVLDYNQLDADAVYRVAERFGIRMPSPDSEIVRTALATYAKDPDGVRVFDDDRARKQREATAAIRNAAERWAMPDYDALKHATVPSVPSVPVGVRAAEARA